MVRTCTVNFPLRLRAQMCIKPRKLKVAGFFPCFFAFLAAYRPNSISRVFSGCSVKPYFSNRFGKTAQHLFRVLLVLEAQDGIISKTDLVGFPF